MAGLAAVKAKILAGQVVGLQDDVRRIVGAASSNGEGQLIIRTCSRFVYDNQSLKEQQFSAVLDIVNICIQHHQQHLTADPFFNLRSMHYIFLLAVRRKELHQHLMGLACSTEPFIELCDASSGDAQSIVKQMHQMLWNTSLTRSSPHEALTLQRLSFQCSLAIGNSVSQVCDQAVKAHAIYENAEKPAEKSAENSDQYFEAIFKYLTQALSKQSACDEDSILSIVSLVMEYAKVAMEVEKCSAFGKNNKQLMKLLEGHCDSKMAMGLKGGLKLPEIAIGLRLGKCGEDMLKKLLSVCGHVAALPNPNTVLILGLVTTISLLNQYLRSNLKLSSYLVELLVKRCRIPISEDIIKKVSCVLSQQLSGFYEMVSSSQEADALFTHILAWADTTKPFTLSNVTGKPDRLAALYNFGAHFGNLGSLAYRKGNYSAAAKFLEFTVDFFDQYCLHASEEQKQNALSNLTKRLRLWSDALRYSNQHWEAGVAASRGFLRGCLPAEDLVIAWVKCKRDAEKVGSKALRGKTVCDVVSEARRKHQEAEGVVYDQAAALLMEIQHYRQQSFNTSEEQLCCGRALAEGRHGAVSSVWGLLAVAEALWTHPDLAVEESDASCAVQQAKDLLQEARAGGSDEPVLLELEALAHFWHYLCYIQTMYAKADAEVKESKKPNPLKPQAKELGEEEQVHDACDVRPTALLTLHTQHASLAPLQAALDIWDTFVMQDLPLKNAATTCASLTSVGYIYHLSGLVTPTLQAWGLLIALARKHSLQNYLIKGIVELLLTAPDLVDSGLVEELQEVVSSVSAASSQDTTLACLTLTASAATALHYYRIGKYDAGARLVEEALRSEVLTRRTIKTTEVQTLVHLVASMYAWLPPWLLHSQPALPAPCFSLALLACRQASALFQTALTDTNKDIICWRHRVASLLLTTTAWLGHLSITTAQPRTARAFLEKSLQFSQRLILPLRIAEFLELLARVDMLCDQLEDCRVKVDNLESLLTTHPSSQEEVDNLMPEFTKLAITKPTKARSTKGPEIFCDPLPSDGERMRTESGVQEFSLKDVPAMLQVEADWAFNSSPSTEYREKITIVRFMPCSSGGVECALCATPIIHQLRISTSVLLALLHAHGERFQTAQKCLEQAQTMYAEAADKAHEVASHLVSLLKRDIKKCVIEPSMFVLSRLNLIRLQTFHARAECLGLEGKWDNALSANLESLQTLAALDTQLLVQDVHFTALLALQGQDLEKILARRTKSPQDTNTSLVVGQQQDKNDICSIIVTTTPKMSTRKKAGQHLLNAPKPVHKKNLIFNIYSDEEEDGSEETKPHRFATPYKPIPHTPSNKFFKSERKRPPSSIKKKKNAENMKALDSLEADWGGGLPSLVLKVPSDLPLSPLNSTPHCPPQPDSAKLGCTTSPQSTKTMGKTGTRTTKATKTGTTRGRSVTTNLSQSTEDAKPQEDAAPQRGRGRPTKAASASASKAKLVSEPKSTTRTRASRSLRLM
ncbi:uncharacterized protein LOC126997000 isoform X3 [Eriocheir sinensis]|nr:uncharacterized protein LOC126997000 isoform X3 [Eriocheir sinensis]XP_050713985.1 uncharacterized protein LOC126997000 isoform X3 [Eriocheir sinensis]XP_050713986.1 uncharacterized protein LOC126997000 isoform X3 [Eriocheir sinensis]XP_050713987.1 uncharacterized protein LOC126997000 isoform X3 [Eriocheir sinensis]